MVVDWWYMHMYMLPCTHARTSSSSCSCRRASTRSVTRSVVVVIRLGGWWVGRHVRTPTGPVHHRPGQSIQSTHRCAPSCAWPRSRRSWRSPPPRPAARPPAASAACRAAVVMVVMAGFGVGEIRGRPSCHLPEETLHPPYQPTTPPNPQPKPQITDHGLKQTCSWSPLSPARMGGSMTKSRTEPSRATDTAKDGSFRAGAICTATTSMPVCLFGGGGLGGWFGGRG